MRLESEVFKVVKNGETLDEAIKNCVETYEELLLVALGSSDEIMRARVEWHLRMNGYVDELADPFLPEQFKGKRYSRLKAIYAQPSLPQRYANLPVFPNQDSSEFVMVKLGVDSSQALVLPLLDIDDPLYYSYRFTRGEIVNIVRNYWGCALTLKEFLETYSEPERKQNPLPWDDPVLYIWKNKKSGSEFYIPEVLIPEWEIQDIKIR